jgi:hypothetical protein
MSPFDEDDKSNQQSPPLDSSLLDEKTDRLGIDSKETEHPEKNEPEEEEEEKTRVVTKEAMLRVISGQP